jgi:mTERF domain-containing protein
MLTRVLAAYPSKYPVSSLHPLISAAATAAVFRDPQFVAEEYLIDTCGLTRAQALKASANLFHLKSPQNPDDVVAFLAGIGLSGADLAALVAKDPLFLCADVEKTLFPVVVGLTGLGLFF